MQILQPTIFFPGTLCDERVWMPVWANLDCRQKAYVPLQWAENLEQMMMLTADRVAAFSEPVHLVGFSMGAYIAAKYALESPDKIASLTLMGYCSDGLTASELAQRKLLINAINTKKYKGPSSSRTKQFLHPENHHKTTLIDTINTMSIDLGGAVLKAHINSTTPREDVTKKLAKLSIPINLMSAENDSVAPQAHIEKMHQVLPNSCFDTVKNAGHMMTLEQPVDVATLLAAKIT